MNKFDLIKLVNTIVYFSEHTMPSKFCKTKILKLLFLSDFKHVEKYGKPITYDTYYHLPFGPVPTLTKNYLDNLQNAKDFELGKELDVFKNAFDLEPHENSHCSYSTIKAKSGVRFNSTKFSKSELEVLKEISKKYFATTAKELVEITHKHIGYIQTGENEKIDYRFAIKHKKDMEYYNYWAEENRDFENFIKKLRASKNSKKKVKAEQDITKEFDEFSAATAVIM